MMRIYKEAAVSLKNEMLFESRPLFDKISHNSNRQAVHRNSIRGLSLL
jgi:hypothetical protein